MSFYAWKPYVPVAERRVQAQRKLAGLQKKGAKVSPVVIEGRTIASSFWGKSWCANLERYSDFASRMPRGRSYVRNGSVLDLQIAKGEITAKVSGSNLYNIRITIAPVPAARWTSLAQDCAGTIDSVVELLQGRIDKGVMDRVCRQDDGLFPAPSEIKLSCSCPDWADMCKHVAAALYGVGARLDRQPELLFALRGVDARDMIARAGAHLATPVPGAASGKVLVDDDMAALFGLDMADDEAPVPAPAARPTHPQSKRTTKLMLDKAVASKRNDAGPGSADITADVRAGHGKLSASPRTDRRRTNATDTSPKQARGCREPLREVIKTPTVQTRGKNKPPALGATTKARPRLETLIEEAIVDAYTVSEQAVGLYTMICDRLALPFKTKILGREADVVAIEMGDDDLLRAVCKVGRKRQSISLADMALPSKRPAGAEWIIAYRHWCGRNGAG
jgi:uncharacterized Zn finger protein